MLNRSSRTELDDDVVDVTSSSVLDVVDTQIHGHEWCVAGNVFIICVTLVDVVDVSSFSALDVVEKTITVAVVVAAVDVV